MKSHTVLVLPATMFAKSHPEPSKDSRWITVHPNGKDHPGQPVLIGKDGHVEGGMGGKFNGKKIDDLHGDPEKPKAPALTPEQRHAIKKNKALLDKRGPKGEGSMGKWKSGVDAGDYDHLWPEHLELEKQADEAEKAAKKAKSDAWKAKNLPKLVAEKKAKEDAWRQEKQANWSDPNAPRTYLQVPFESKDSAKAAGAKWDVTKKQWYHTFQETPSGLKMWLPKTAAAPSAPPAKAAAPAPAKPQGPKVLPKTGYVSEDDPSIYGHWLLGHEGEPWAKVRSYAPATFTKSLLILPVKVAA